MNILEVVSALRTFYILSLNFLKKYFPKRKRAKKLWQFDMLGVFNYTDLQKKKTLLLTVFMQEFIMFCALSREFNMQISTAHRFLIQRRLNKKKTAYKCHQSLFFLLCSTAN